MSYQEKSIFRVLSYTHPVPLSPQLKKLLPAKTHVSLSQYKYFFNYPIHNNQKFPFLLLQKWVPLSTSNNAATVKYIPQGRRRAPSPRPQLCAPVCPSRQHHHPHPRAKARSRCSSAGRQEVQRRGWAGCLHSRGMASTTTNGTASMQAAAPPPAAPAAAAAALPQQLPQQAPAPLPPPGGNNNAHKRNGSSSSMFGHRRSESGGCVVPGFPGHKRSESGHKQRTESLSSAFGHRRSESSGHHKTVDSIFGHKRYRYFIERDFLFFHYEGGG